MEDLNIPRAIQSIEYSMDSGIDGSSHTFFVANVNVNSDGTLKVNVNQLENSNVWNAENRHCMVAPKLTVSLTP